MTRDDIIRMAREACWTGIYSEWSSPTERTSIEVPVTIEQIERFAALVAAAEREECAKVCENLVIEHPGRADLTAQQCAFTIRERGAP
jgi:hypothetical protein